MSCANQGKCNIFTLLFLFLIQHLIHFHASKWRRDAPPPVAARGRRLKHVYKSWSSHAQIQTGLWVKTALMSFIKGEDFPYGHNGGGGGDLPHQAQRTLTLKERAGDPAGVAERT